MTTHTRRTPRKIALTFAAAATTLGSLALAPSASAEEITAPAPDPGLIAGLRRARLPRPDPSRS